MLTEERYERVLQAACAAGMPFKDIKKEADTQVSERARNNAAKSYYFHDDEELIFSRRSLCDITGLKNGKKGFVLTSSYLYSSEFDQKRKNRIVRLPLYNMAGVEVLDEAAGRYAVNYKDGGRIEFHLSKHKEGVFALLNQVIQDDAAVTDPEALCQKGRDLYNEGKYEQAFNVFLNGAQVGHARSQWWVGNCCANERGFHSGWKDKEGLFHPGWKDYREANKWYDLAARQGDPLAQRSLAYNFLTGREIRKDVQAAQYWYARAAEEYKKEAEEGDPSAMFWMGIFYRNGWGVKEDAKQAFYWFKKAADQGHETSQFLTAERLYYGRGTDRDVQLAKTYAQKAKDIVCWAGERPLS
ncbi:MAG: sel1 repeat family protein, partial [Clostridiales bacterium]|nr:sel1 repeat family protein [Clostridiales bacterium]